MEDTQVEPALRPVGLPGLDGVVLQHGVRPRDRRSGGGPAPAKQRPGAPRPLLAATSEGVAWLPDEHRVDVDIVHVGEPLTLIRALVKDDTDPDDGAGERSDGRESGCE